MNNLIEKISNFAAGERSSRYLKLTVLGLSVACVLAVGIISNRTLEVAASSCAAQPIASVTASGYGYPNTPQNSIDGNLATRWSNEGIGSWIQLQLKSPVTVCQVKVAWYKGNLRSTQFTVGLSKDGSALTTGYSGWSSGSSTALETYNIASVVNTQYVRITGLGTTTDDWASITEIQIFGNSALPSVTITSPSSGSQFTAGTVKLAGVATAGSAAISKVEVKIDGDISSYKLATPEAPGDWSTWSINYNLPTGSHALTARVTDAAGVQSWDAVTLIGLSTQTGSITTGNSQYDAYDSYILTSVQKYGFPDPMLIKAQMYLESDFLEFDASTDVPCSLPSGWATSEGHSYGLMQITPACNVYDFSSAGLLLSNGHPNLVKDTTSSLWSNSIYNPNNNIGFATASMMTEYTNMKANFGGCTSTQYEEMALSSYNSGSDSVLGCGVYNARGQSYVDKVAADYDELAALAGISNRL